MYTIKSIRTTVTPNQNEDLYYDAEAKIVITDEDGNNEKEAYVLVHWDADIYRFFYSCTSESIYDFVTKSPEEELTADFIEFFDFIEDAVNSEFINLYCMLDNILSDMFKGPSRPITYQAKMLNFKTKAIVDNDNEEYHFEVIQSIEYSGERYEVIFFTETDQEDSIILKKEKRVLEQYDDLQDASSSKWFVIFCAVKEKLIKFINNYIHDHIDCGLNSAWVTRDLMKDWTDLKSDIWKQR
jgi:hypothetical protein